MLDFGLVAGAAALGAFTAAILSTFLLSDKSDETVDTNLLKPHRQVHLIAAMTVAVATTAVVTFIGYQIGTLTAIWIAAATLGFAGQLLKINADTTIQRSIDDAHRGRVFSIFDMMINVALVIGITTYSLIEAARENVNVGATYSIVLLSASTGLSFYLFTKYRRPEA